MSDKRDKRDILGLDDEEPLPKFGKRRVRPPVTEEEKQERRLEDFRDEARSLLQQGRERDDEESAEAKTSARKAGLFRFGRSASNDGEPETEAELSEEEEWRRRMSRYSAPEPDAD